jgi:hypothetical protein
MIFGTLRGVAKSLETTNLTKVGNGVRWQIIEFLIARFHWLAVLTC